MHSLLLSSIVFVLVFTGALAGMALRRALPADHLGTDAKETVRLAIGMVVTMTGLVLGMLVSSAKTYYDSQKNVVAQMSSDIILLDSLLKSLGPGSKDLRLVARKSVEDSVYRIWPKEKSRLTELRPQNAGQDVDAQLEAIVPRNAAETSTKAQIVTLLQNLKRTYWLMFLNSEQTSMSIPLLVVVTLWLVTIFISFGVFAPPNSTVMVTLIVCALAVSAAIFIIMEMYAPFSGIMRISPVAVLDALSQMEIDH